MHYFIFLFLIFCSQLCCDQKLEEALSSYFGNSILQIQPIEKGNSNTNYKVSHQFQTYFVKVGCQSNELFDVSMKQEWIGNQLASEKGLAPKGLYYSPDNRIMITEFIEANQEIDVHDSQFISIFCKSLRKLHALNGEALITYSPFQRIESYFSKSQERGLIIPEVLQENLMYIVHQIEKKWGHRMRSVPCHLDLNKGNLLYDGDRLWLIDWEYSGLSEPYHDLAFFVINNDLSTVETIELLRLYENKEPSKEDIAFFYAMCFLAELRESLWSLLTFQMTNQEKQYTRYERLLNNCLKRINSIDCDL